MSPSQRDVKDTSGPPHNLKQPLPKGKRESFLTYISCAVHRNAVSEPLGGGGRSLARGAHRTHASCAGQAGRIWDGAVLVTHAPAPRQSSCTAHAGGGRQATWNCAPVPAAEATGRSGTPSSASVSNLTGKETAALIREEVPQPTAGTQQLPKPPSWAPDWSQHAHWLATQVMNYSLYNPDIFPI